MPIQCSSLFLTSIDCTNSSTTINEGSYDLDIVAQDIDMDVDALEDLDASIVSLSYVSQTLNCLQSFLCEATSFL